MCEKCEALQARCEDLANWVISKNLRIVSDEDKDLLDFLISKTHEGFPILTIADLRHLAAASYSAGLRKGYEIKQLELLSS